MLLLLVVLVLARARCRCGCACGGEADGIVPFSYIMIYIYIYIHAILCNAVRCCAPATSCHHIQDSNRFKTISMFSHERQSLIDPAMNWSSYVTTIDIAGWTLRAQHTIFGSWLLQSLDVALEVAKLEGLWGCVRNEQWMGRWEGLLPPVKLPCLTLYSNLTLILPSWCSL